MKRNKRGFTLTELMIVIAVIAILAMVAVPKYSDLVLKAKEAAVKGSLGSIRSSVSIYYSHAEGTFPHDIASALVPKFIDRIPLVSLPKVPRYGSPGHANMNQTWSGTIAANLCDANTNDIWLYVNSGSEIGKVVVNCVHRDSRGNYWTSY